jgi:hypothetical protein
MACRVVRDDNGSLYQVPAAPTMKNAGGKWRPGFPRVDVWWDRARDGETLIIRQENEGKADVVSLTLGQVYDLIHALGWAIKRP